MCNAQTVVSSQQQQQQQERRTPQQTLHLPPAPINPFRGGISTVHNENESDTNEDRHDSRNNSNRRHASVEVRSRNDYNLHGHRHGMSSSIQHAAAADDDHNNIKTYHSWTPEEFPDPWTNPLLCGGAAAAAQLHSLHQLHTLNNNNQTQTTNIDSTPSMQQQQQQIMTRPLLCDPDQVLDESTMRDVMAKLMEFSREFASRNHDDVEGGDGEFGWWDVGVTEDYNTEEDEGHDGDQTTHHEQHDTRRRRLLRHHVISNQDDIPIITKHKRRQLLSSHNKHTLTDKDTIEVAIALVQKINLSAILRADAYFFYSDQDDMVNDAAQYFARYVHESWNKRVMMMREQRSDDNDVDVTTNIILIFISVHDRICYISSGTRIAFILPWWRLEHVVQDMKPMLRKGQTGDALHVAIDDMTSLIRSGNPTMRDRVDDFFTRFGVVLAFAFFTFLFATYGEFQERRQRIDLAERRSHMNDKEREKARSLQQEFQTKVCPICLEAFGGCGDDDDVEKEDDVAIIDDAVSTSSTKESITKKEEQAKLKRVDSYGIPRKGNDGRPIKLLRCGHIFDETCWEMWVDSGHSNAMMCPVCRQDIGRKKKRARSRDADVATTTSSSSNTTVGNNNSTQQSLFFRLMEHAHAATAPATLTNYSSTTSAWSTATFFDAQERVNDDSSESSLYPTETTPLI